MLDRFLAWVTEKNFFAVRSFMLYVSVWMTVEATRWAFAYAQTSKLTAGVDIAAVIVAATGPITAFTGFVYKWYSEGRNGS